MQFDTENKKDPMILVTGACGQIGTELVVALRKKYGRANVIATDIHDRSEVQTDQPYFQLDILNAAALEWMVSNLQITQVYHLAAVLSANGEKEPLKSWDLNMRGLLNVLEAARIYKLEKVFWPSSIAVFGPASIKDRCPQNSPQDPVTSYGISKVAGEYWCRYYHEKYGIDIRSIRFPGLISYRAAPGGGTTDYAVDIFHQASENGHYFCFLKPYTRLPMLYMPDAIRGTIELMEAPPEKLSITTAYNLAGVSFTPAELAVEIAARVNGFDICYQPDERQVIADSWPASIDDSAAQEDWGWQPSYDLQMITQDMLMQLRKKKEGIHA